MQAVAGSPKFSPKEWGILLLLAAIQFANILDFVLMMPLADFIKRKFDVDSQQFGYLVAAYGIAASLSAIAAAAFIDRFDRKHALLGLLVGFTLSTGACGLAHSFWALLSARVCAGVFGGVLGSIIMAIIGDLFADNRRGTATGVVMSAFALSTIVGVPLGLTIAESYDLNAPFLVLALFAALLTGVIAVWMPPLRQHLLSWHSSALDQFAGILKNREYVKGYLFSACVVSGGFFVVPFLADYMVNNVGRKQEDVKYVYLVGGLCTLVSLNVIGRLADKYGKKPVFRVVAVGALLMTLTLTNLPSVPLGVMIAVTAAYMVFTSGRMVPAMALLTSLAQPRERGAFLSLNTAVQHMIMGLAALISGQILSQGEHREIIGFERVGLVSACVAVASLFIVGTLKVAPVAKPVEAAAEEEMVPAEAVA